MVSAYTYCKCTVRCKYRNGGHCKCTVDIEKGGQDDQRIKFPFARAAQVSRPLTPPISLWQPTLKITIFKNPTMKISMRGRIAFRPN